LIYLFGFGAVALVFDLLDVSIGVEDPEGTEGCDVLHCGVSILVYKSQTISRNISLFIGFFQFNLLSQHEYKLSLPLKIILS